MKKVIRLTEGDLHRIVRESVNMILKEEEENGGRECIFYEPQPLDGGGFSDEKEEWDEAGVEVYDFYMVKDPEIAEFHFSPEGYTIYCGDEEFGEVWFERSEGCYIGNSDNDVFNGYTRGFEGATLNGVFEDMFNKIADSILYGDEDEE